MLEIFVILGKIFFAILSFIFLLVILVAVAGILQIWANRRYSNIWHDLKPSGKYKVLKVLWTDGSIGLLIYYHERNAVGHAIYSCSSANIWKMPREGDYLKPRMDSYAIPPFDIVQES